MRARQCTRLLPLFKPKACNCKCQAAHFAVRTHDTFGRSRRASRNVDAARSAFALSHYKYVHYVYTNVCAYVPHVCECVCICVYLYSTMARTPWKSDSLDDARCVRLSIRLFLLSRFDGFQYFKKKFEKHRDG